MFPHPDNRHAFVTVRNDNSMLVLDLTTGETLDRVEVQSSPDGVTYSPVRRRRAPTYRLQHGLAARALDTNEWLFATNE